MKYDISPSVRAIYSSSPYCDYPNPFLEALPELMSKDELFCRLQSFPPLPSSGNTDEGYGVMGLNNLGALFVAMDYMYTIYQMLHSIIESGSKTISTYNALISLGVVDKSYTYSVAPSPSSSSILGVPGIGKSSTVRRCLMQIPQIIEHINYFDKKLYCKQVTYITVECPSDCSIKTLVLNILAAINEATGSNYDTSLEKRNISVLTGHVKKLCKAHHIGVIVIDEIQNAIASAKSSSSVNVRALLKFLIELSNETCAGMCYVGTTTAEEFFSSYEHLKRRTRGLRLLPLHNDEVYYNFLKTIWRYQYTETEAKLSSGLANLIYDLSGGIPAYIVKVFQEAQLQAIYANEQSISKALILKGADMLDLDVPELFSKGISISDFHVGNIKKQRELTLLRASDDVEPKDNHPKSKGRPKAARGKNDILVIAKAFPDTFLEELIQRGLAEVYND